MATKFQLQKEVERLKAELDTVKTKGALGRMTEGVAAAAVGARRSCRIVCIAASMRHGHERLLCETAEKMAAKIPVAVCCDTKSDPVFRKLSPDERQQALDAHEKIHAEMVDLADELLVVDIGEEIGEGLDDLVKRAASQGKTVRYLTNE